MRGRNWLGGIGIEGIALEIRIGHGAEMPRFPRHPFAEQRAKELRRNLTDSEALPCCHIRHDIPAKFRWQEPIVGYICDFVCYTRRLIVELDGSQHADSVHDVRRDAWLRAQGFTILRFWNDEVMRECDDVLHTIYNAVVDAPE
jgi:very-short-patch-repair endonuclease